MAAAALVLASVAFDVLALDGVQTSKDDPKGRERTRRRKVKSHSPLDADWYCRLKLVRLSAK
jgi:hypothetical protein